MQDFIYFCFALCLLVLAIRLGTRKRRYLEKFGIRSVATIISIEKTLIKQGGIDRTPLMKIILGIKVEGTEYREVTIKQDFFLSELPKAGEEVPVLIDPENADHVLILNRKDW